MRFRIYIYSYLEITVLYGTIEAWAAELIPAVPGRKSTALCPVTISGGKGQGWAWGEEKNHLKPRALSVAFPALWITVKMKWVPERDMRT